LQHFLELETGLRPQQVQQIPADLTQFFIEVAQLFRQTDAFLAEKNKTTSPMLKVRLIETGQDWTDKLNALQKQLNARQEDLATQLKSMDAEWLQHQKSGAASQASEILRRLEELYRLFSYYTRWESQVQERIVQLAL
jgi:hypothetical protein